MTRPLALDPEILVERNELRTEATRAISAYLANRSDSTLATATAALRAYRGRYGPLVIGEWVWTLNVLGELIKLPAKVKGRA